MKIIVKHIFSNDNYSIGNMSVEGKYLCNTLEDPQRPVKIAGRTGIPNGTYKVVLSNSFRFKKVLPEIQNVPGFVGVRIHAGNTAEDTEGCILVGFNTEKGRLTKSREAFYSLMELLHGAKARKEEITLEVI